MIIAYLVNQYPKVSHSFIRREIVELEACGLEIRRFAIRSCESELIDEADKLELTKTRLVLGVGKIGLLISLLRVFCTRPIRFAIALWLTLKIGWGSDRGVLNHLAYLAEAAVVLGWCLEEKISQIHAHFGTNSTTVAMLCHLLGGLPYSFTVHGPEEFDKVQGIALTEKIERAAFVVAISSFGKSQLYRWCDREYWSKIHVIHCGVDEIFFQRDYIPIPTEPRLVCVGRLSEQKGHLLLIEAASKLGAEGLDFKLVLVGDGPLRSQIESRIIQLGLQNHIEITGWASNTEVQEQILSSRALILPSFAEGLPVVIMESLALGRPALSTYVAGIPELIESGVCGWLIPPGSVEALTDGMRKILQLPIAELAQMGKTGIERVAEQHDAGIEAAKLAKLFQFDLDLSASLAKNNYPRKDVSDLSISSIRSQ